MTSKASGHNLVRKVYLDVIDDVISNVTEMFADEGVDENVLQELRTLWNKKLKESKALESPPEDRRMPGDDKGKVRLKLFRFVINSRFPRRLIGQCQVVIILHDQSEI